MEFDFDVKRDLLQCEKCKKCETVVSIKLSNIIIV